MVIMRLNKKQNRIQVRSEKKNIQLRHLTHNIQLRHAGRKGEEGPIGPPGIGIPEGGVDGEILVKDGLENHVTKWAQPLSFSDKNFVADFTVTNVVAVNHGLSKYCSVSVIDSAGEEVIGEVDYLNTNQLIVRFELPFSGRITCN